MPPKFRCKKQLLNAREAKKLALLQLLVALHSSERFTHSHIRQHRKLLPQGKTVHVCLPGGLQARQRTRKPGKRNTNKSTSHTGELG